MACDISLCRTPILIGSISAFLVFLVFYILLYLYILYYTYRYNSDDLHSWKDDKLFNIKQKEMSNIASLETESQLNKK